MSDSLLAKACDWIGQADSLLICAGAGMSADSGLPAFRDSAEFWQAYPALAESQIDFENIANPDAFGRWPRLAWGFYGQRLAHYRATPPHAGFGVLRRIAGRLPHGAFIFTSNVDGQFQRAGFSSEQICECHGSLHHLQCTQPCSDNVWSADGFAPAVDEDTCRLIGPLPRCDACGALARPNVLMFGDAGWIMARSRLQHQRLEAWLGSVQSPVIIELGAGTQVPTVRWVAESVGRPLIRINLSASGVPSGLPAVGINQHALPALQALERLLSARGFFEAPH
jgi:NAD-dependent SIR2 family protein deacetylase